MTLDPSNIPLVGDSSLGVRSDPIAQTTDLAIGSSDRNLVFIDATITDPAILTNNFHNARVIWLNADSDGIAQITNVLGQQQNIASVHIISHGSQGDIQLGNSHLNLASLPSYSGELQQWGNALTDDADLLFYGCNVAAASDGVELVRQLSQITGADIAASNNLTGNVALGGDWELEVTTGKIEAVTQSIRDYQGILPIYNGKEYLITSSAKSWEQAQAEAQSLGGNLVTINNSAEENWLKQTFGTRSPLWIGLTDRVTEGKFQWANGETASYRNWDFGKPNNNTYGGASPTGEDYVVMNAGNNRWNDLPNSYAGTFRGIIERDPVYTYNGKKYQLTNSAKSWEQAQAEAQSLGGNLVTINNSAEENWLKQTFGTRSPLWIGLTDRVTEGKFQWANGETASYRNWDFGKPNNNTYGGASPTGEDYVVMNAGNNRWNDLPNSYAGTFRGIIEFGSTKPGTIGIETNSYQIDEQTGTATVKVLRQGGSDGTVTVDYRTIDASAKAGSDYTAVTGRLTFAPGETSKSIAIAILNDQLVEGNENFNLKIDNVLGGATLAANQTATINIKDDDVAKFGTIGIETNSYQIDERAGTATVKVLRQNGSDGTVTVDYRTIDASAKAGSDYTAVTGRLTFAPGETSKSIAIAILNDQLVEGNENFNLTIDNVLGGATLLAPRTATITIKDDEATTELFAFNDFSSTNDLTFNGNASQSANRLRLTPDLTNQGGSVFLNKPLAIDANTSFSTQFQFQLAGTQGTNGADGFTFMLQNSPNAMRSIGVKGENLGYLGIGKSLAIEFDTSQNLWDNSNNHISLLRDGVITQSLTTVNAPFDLNSGTPLTAWIDYNGTTNNLQVFLSNTTTKPGVATLTYNIDLATVVGSQAFLGFSGGTSESSNTQDILNWSSSSNSNLLPAPPPPSIVQKQTTIANLVQPTAIDWIPNSSKMFIAEKNGVIKVFENGQLKSTPFIDLSATVNSARDRGLLDIAVHPDFLNGKPYVYAFYNYDPPEVFQNSGLAGPDGIGNRANRVTRITADPTTNYTTAIAGSEVVILGKNSTWNNFNAFANSTVDFNEKPAGILADGTNIQDFITQDSESHGVGSIEFGPDGSLYVSIGDGASYNQVDPRGVRVQDIDNLSGKVLRIDPITGAGLANNPFYNGNANANRSKVYQYGFRNPFRMTISPQNGQVYVGDVGWTQWEEINAGGPGANFGWPYYEGGNGVSLRTGSYQDLPAAKAFYASGQQVTPSLLGLNNAADGINAIILGDIYTGTTLGAQYRGDLFFNDLGRGIVRNVSLDASGKIVSVDTFATGAEYVIQIAQGPDGNLYYVDLDDGIVGRWELK